MAHKVCIASDFITQSVEVEWLTAAFVVKVCNELIA
jgi:hypothetical protein